MDTQPSVAMILNDVQGEFYDPRAFEVALQIGEHIKPTHLCVNGDWVDWPSMSVKYTQRAQKGQFALSFKKSVAKSRACLAELVSRVQAPRGIKQVRLWNDGNHEWRLFRALHVIPQVSKLLELDHIRVATSIPAVLGTEAYGFRYSGEYPAGCWLFATGNPITDVWVEHGYIARKKAGYTGTAIREERMTNVVIGHVERLALAYQHAVGGRDLFSVENGNLSLLGIPGKGDAKYSSAPFNIADYANRQQGISIITKIGNRLFPEVVPIIRGQAIYGGRLFKA